MVGVATLYELLAAGRDAVLVEAAADVASGASHANGGVLHPSATSPWNGTRFGIEVLAALVSRHSALRIAPRQLPNLFFWGMQFLRHATPHRHWLATRDNYILAAYSVAHTRALIATHEFAIEQRDAGMINIFDNAHAFDNAIALAARLAPFGLRYDTPDGATLALREPLVAQKEFALHFHGDMVGDARAFTQRLVAIAQSMGGDVRLNTRADALLMEGGRVCGVQCGDTRLEGDVVLASGYAAPQLARQAGLRLPIRPAKGYSLTFTLDGAKMPRYPMLDNARHIAITPFANRLRVLGTAELAGADVGIAKAQIETLAQFARTTYPTLAADLQSENGTAWAGLRPLSADGRPFIGASKVAGLWLNCGHGHLGWTMAAGSARLLVAHMTAQKCPIDPRAFLPTRAIYAPAA